MVVEDPKARRWADLEDDIDENEIDANGLIRGKYQPETVSGANVDGWQTRTTHYVQGGWVLRCQEKFKKYTTKSKVYKVTAERKQWERFGEARNMSADTKVTVQATEHIKMEPLVINEKEVTRKQFLGVRKPPGADLDMGLSAIPEMSEQDARLEAQERRQQLLEEKQRGGKYIPRHLKQPISDGMSRASGSNYMDGGTVRVTNLPADVEEDDLREKFREVCSYSSDGRSNPIKRVKLQQNKGVAYITYANRNDAKRAAEVLDHEKFEYMVINVEFLVDN